MHLKLGDIIIHVQDGVYSRGFVGSLKPLVKIYFFEADWCFVGTMQDFKAILNDNRFIIDRVCICGASLKSEWC